MRRLQIIRIGLLGLLLTSMAETALAYFPNDYKKGEKSSQPIATGTRSDCNQGSSRFDMDVNNVRAALLSSGDVWWDLDEGQYVVPKVQPGTGARAVSAIFAGAVWLGGKDPLGNLKVAVQTYRSATRTDFWPGPLNANGQTGAETCEKWDKHFVVSAADIDSMRNLALRARANNTTIECGLVPESLKGWPATGNPYFFDVHRFTLPRDKQGLAKFHDEDGDGLYDPCKGDYPTIDIKGCNISVYPDQMVFWIYNDNGGVHTQSARSTPIQMEVQVQAFAYKTNDQLNDMTFQRYKLINRAKTDIDSTYFAMWVDADLGCYTDDYVGCDTSRSLAYYYNQDALDGTNGCVCDGGVNTYCDKIPLLGIDYFRGPGKPLFKPDGTPLRNWDNTADSTVELGMSSFTYYLNSGVCNPLPGTTDPSTATEYYNYLTGKWRDGTPFSFGGSSYNPGAAAREIKFAFVQAPNDAAGWSMCSANLPCGDRRTIQASGPFRLIPGAINELIVGVPWVADQDYPCPSIAQLQEADDIAQALFDNCFKIFDGPDAPDVSFVELDKEIIAVLTNAPESNNFREQYTEKGLDIPASATNNLYRFQGYKVYQLRDGDVGVADLENAEKSRLVAQVDIQDTITKVWNWTPTPDPNFPGRIIYTPVLRVDGENKGIRNTFRITEDRFAATDDRRLVNHKKYYFVAIAYAYNNYAKFDEKTATGLGQRRPYVVGRRNIGDKNRGGKPYEVMPRPIVDVKIGAKYGEGPVITRLDGVGTGKNFLDISEETLNKILNNQFDGTITYAPGRGPVDVKIYNPLEVVDGTYELTIRDGNMADNVVDNTARWQLKQTGSNDVLVSESTLQRLNEQVIAKYGFSISIGQVADAGSDPTGDKTNGSIGSEVVYSQSGLSWLSPIPEGQAFIPGLNILNYVKNDLLEPDFDLDPNKGLSNTSSIFFPYYLCDYRTTNINEPMVSPAWQNANGASVRQGNSLTNLNNVDIILTKDKSKWSRCVVVETASPYYTDAAQGPRLPAEGNVKMFDLRKKPSVGKNAGTNGLPTPDNDGEGMGWFPGYAVDVETGKRLNIFFGENSVFDPNIGNYTTESKGNTRDMMWNPTSQVILTVAGLFDPGYAAFFGGQHFIYVTNTDYDSCKLYRDRFTGSALRKISALRTVTWAGMPMLTQGTRLLSYADGLIPNDVRIKLRVNNSYAPAKAKGTNNDYPSYQFTLSNKAAKTLTNTQADSALNLVNIVPNPYYGYSAYEINEFSTTVKITNLPAVSTVTVYTLDGKFIRQFKRDERPAVNPTISNLGIRAKQIAPDLEWDMKNEKGIPVASGVYLIHIDSPQGQRTLKFFAVNRQFDPSRL